MVVTGGSCTATTITRFNNFRSACRTMISGEVPPIIMWVNVALLNVVVMVRDLASSAVASWCNLVLRDVDSTIFQDVHGVGCAGLRRSARCARGAIVLVCVSAFSCGEAASDCPATGTACSGICVDLQSDTQNCGACGSACPAGEGCAGGTCTPQCTAHCGDVCVDLAHDDANCGACGNACPDGQKCADSKCQPTCAPGLTACNLACVDLSNDLDSCGGCGHACFGSCVQGVCTEIVAAPVAPLSMKVDTAHGRLLWLDTSGAMHATALPGETMADQVLWPSETTSDFGGGTFRDRSRRSGLAVDLA